jgi:hypothetical protein
MKTELLLRKHGGTLRPDGDASWEMFDRIPNNASIVVTVRHARNADHLKKYWATAAAVADADPEFADREDADHWVRMSIPGMRDEYRIGPGDRVGVRLKSIALDEMDQGEFSRFYDRAIELWAMRIGMDPEQLLTEARSRTTSGRP